MAAAPQAGTALKRVRDLITSEQATALPDAELLGRFTAGRDEGAFAALVRRHGGLVLGVCRRVLGNHADADDAFQATFLVLARKAAAIANQASLPCWLYQVAFRTAVKAKSLHARRRAHEARVERPDATDPLAEVTGRELLAVLDEELQRLSECLRAPLVLCYLEGRTRDEAARELGWSVGTLKRRLDQARGRLRQRLARRGLALPAALLTAGLVQGVASASLPPRLAAGTADAVRRLAAGAPGGTALAPAVVALAEGVLRASSAAKLWAASLLLLLGGVVALAAGALAGPGAVSAPPPAAQGGDKAPVPVPGKGPAKEQGRMTVTGRVLNADGKSLAGALVAVVGFLKDQGRGGDLVTKRSRVLARGRTDADGRIRLAAAAAPSEEFRALYLLARAPGYGLSFQRLNPALPAAEASLRLDKEQVVRGRLVGLQGQPAAGVTVWVDWTGQLRNGESEGVHFGGRPQDLPVWPEAVKADAQGRFAVHGLGGSLKVRLAVEGDGYGPQAIYLEPSDLTKEIHRSLAPAQLIEGQVLQADTGKPVPHALLTVYASDREDGSYGGMGGEADAEGRFRLNPYPGKWFTLAAHPPTGEPYLAIEKRFKWEAGKVKLRMDLPLPRGVLVRGKITEAGSGKPVARAAVHYYPQRAENRDFRRDIISGWQGAEVSKADGTFQIAVLPGPGHLLVIGQGGQYVHEEIGDRVLYDGRPGGTRYYPDAVVKLALPKETQVKDVAVTLKRGASVKGRLTGPGGEPVGKALMICRLHVTALNPYWRFPVEVRDGQFELHGLDPEKSCPVSFLEPQKGWGTTVQLSGKDAGKPLTIKLQPCGQAVARFVNAAGKPLAGHYPMIDIVVTPGAHRYDRDAAEKGLLAADEEFLANVDRHNYWKGPVTDADGRCTFRALIPGVTYRFTNYRKGRHYVERDFTVEPGKTFDAGVITIARPQ
jgi:RNA polymerase sigma factor (sigma-70 family)